MNNMKSQNKIKIEGKVYKAVSGICIRGGGCDKCDLEGTFHCINPKLMICCSSADRVDKKDVVWIAE